MSTKPRKGIKINLNHIKQDQIQSRCQNCLNLRSFHTCLGHDDLVDLKRVLVHVKRASVMHEMPKWSPLQYHPKYFLESVWAIICSIIINVQLQIFIQSDIWMVECLMWMNCWEKNNLNEAGFSKHKTFILLCQGFQMSEWILLFQATSFFRLPLCFTVQLWCFYQTQIRSKIGLVII